MHQNLKYILEINEKRLFIREKKYLNWLKIENSRWFFNALSDFNGGDVGERKGSNAYLAELTMAYLTEFFLNITTGPTCPYGQIALVCHTCVLPPYLLC